MDSIPIKIHLPPAAAIRSTSSSSRSKLALICATQCTCAFRTNESVENELLLLKARAREEGGQIAVFFIDDNFAINLKRTKSLLRDIIAAYDHHIPWRAD
jgi:hypothetical protein